jgi:DNA polymerase III alpha subunit (gram-positive type)
MKKEIYISTDIESNGPIPGINSMLSLASVAFDENGEEISEFEINFKELVGSISNEKTMKWWNEEHLDEYKESRQNQIEPEIAIEQYYNWLMDLKKQGEIIFVAYPVAFDFMWCFWYLNRFKGDCPFGHNGIDIRSYAMAMFKKSYILSGKNIYPKEWFEDLKLTHKAIDDARMQGKMFVNMKKENEKIDIKMYNGVLR